jgi:hypothetical protein
VWERGAARERENRERRIEESGRENRGRRRRLGFFPGARAAENRDWAPSGPTSVGFVFFQIRDAILKSSKNHKNSPKIFINKILVFRLIITILLNYYFNY